MDFFKEIPRDVLQNLLNESTVTLMADLVGAPRENVSRACKVLTDRELIQNNSGVVSLAAMNLPADWKEHLSLSV